MDVFRLRRRLVDHYGSYVSSYIRIKDERVEEVVHSSLGKGMLRPDPSYNSTPPSRKGETIEELVAEGTLHDEGCTPEGRGVSYRDDPETAAQGRSSQDSRPLP